MTLTDPNLNKTTWQYDALNRVTTETIEIDSAPLSREYAYDDNSNLTEYTDREGRVTTYEYDHQNGRTAEKWYDGVTLERTIGFQYDLAGNLTQLSDPSATYTHHYDRLSRQTNAAQIIAGLTPAVRLAYGYDASGRMTSSAATQ